MRAREIDFPVVTARRVARELRCPLHPRPSPRRCGGGHGTGRGHGKGCRSPHPATAHHKSAAGFDGCRRFARRSASGSLRHASRIHALDSARRSSVASGEVALPCESVVAREAVRAHRNHHARHLARVRMRAPKSLESMSGAITLHRDARVAGDVETGSGELVLEPGSEVAGSLSNDTGTIRIDGARSAAGSPRPTATSTSGRTRASTAASSCTSAT